MTGIFLKLRKSSLYRYCLWIALGVSFIILLRLNTILTNPTYIPADDFVRYWAAGRLMAQGGNPYDPAQVQVIQDLATGEDASSIVLTPVYPSPWSLPFFALFGIIDYPTSRLLFLLANVVFFLLSAELTWKIYHGETKKKFWSWIVCFTLAATISTLEKGQITAVMLLGIVGFLFFLDKEKGWLAGASLVLVTWKPQLFYLLWPVLGLWSLQSKNYRPILGALGFTAVSGICALAINPNVMNHYLNAILHLPPFMFATPSIGAYLRYFFFGIEKNWPNFLPMAAGLIWIGVDWIRWRKQWIWKEKTAVLLFVSLITAAYIWTYDMALFVLPSIQAVIWILSKKPSGRIWIAFTGFLIINLLNLLLHRYFDDFWFLWYAPALFIWFLVVRKLYKPSGLLIEKAT